MSLVGQLAAVTALQDPLDYEERYAETAALRGLLTRQLEAVGLDVVDGCANFVLGHLPAAGPGAAAVVRACQDDGVYLRDASTMGTSMGSDAVRVAVKERPESARIADALQHAIGVLR